MGTTASGEHRGGTGEPKWVSELTQLHSAAGEPEGRCCSAAPALCGGLSPTPGSPNESRKKGRGAHIALEGGDWR